jgi:RimJ/RimL family protein N-acetyltransferase
MRPATLADRPAIEAFLRTCIDTAMFPLSNLAAYGMSGGHPYAMRFWLPGDPVIGVLGITDSGMIMPVLSPEMAQDAARCLSGAEFIGILGQADSAVALRHALGLDAAPTRLAKVEPHFALTLADMRMPETHGLRLTPFAAAPFELMVEWAAAYDVEALGAAPERAMAEAETNVAHWIVSDSHRILWRGDTPVARTGFNAQLPDIVQIGGVYVPPEMRGHGYARAAVALHLQEAQQRGVTRTTLFSASDIAARAYRAIGFQQIGHFYLCLFDGPQQVPHG